jgi:hypothetical protein
MLFGRTKRIHQGRQYASCLLLPIKHILEAPEIEIYLRAIANITLLIFQNRVHK